jgi:D-sedoheptulose 7-phosphate isomerase
VEQSQLNCDTVVLTSRPDLAAATRYLLATHAALEQRQATFSTALQAFAQRAGALAAIADALVNTLRRGGKILVAGTGGSAAEAQHFAGELIGRFLMERQPYAALALTVDSSILTAVGNDYGFDDIFARQVSGLGRAGDLLLLYSTSGESDNLIRAARVARERCVCVAAITGDRASRLADGADLALRVPATDIPLIQELQMIVTHVLCGIVERELAGTGDGVLA